MTTTTTENGATMNTMTGIREAIHRPDPLALVKHVPAEDRRILAGLHATADADAAARMAALMKKNDR